MNNKMSDKKKTFLYILGMIISFILIFCVIVFLDMINETVQMVIIFGLIAFFAYLGERLITSVLHQHNSKKRKKIANEELKYWDSKEITLLKFCDDAIKNNYTINKLNILVNSSEIDLIHLQKIINKKGYLLWNLFALEYPLSIPEFKKVEEKIHKEVLSSVEKIGFKTIIERVCIILIFGENYTEEEIKNHISRFDFTYAPYITVVIDTKEKRVYHTKIPFDNFTLKGKIFKKARTFVSEYLYKKILE